VSSVTLRHPPSPVHAASRSQVELDPFRAAAAYGRSGAFPIDLLTSIPFDAILEAMECRAV
jgi:hypothetical protein